MKKVKLLLLFQLFSFSYTYGQNPDGYLNPPQLKDGISSLSASQGGLNTALLKALSHKIDSGHYKNIHSVLIMQNGKLLMEKYAGGYTRDSLHSIRSISKFLTSTLLGLAIENKHIKSLEKPVFDFLPDHQYLQTEDKNKILLKHLITMSAGLQWRESDLAYGTAENDETQMYRDGRWVHYTFSKPVVHKPGTVFEYSGGLANTTAVVLENALPTSPIDFARDKLFAPLGITDFRWRTHRTKSWLSAAAGAYLKPRDLLKIGKLYLNGGTWQGKRLLSEEWTNQAGTAHVPVGQMGPFTLAYGYTVLVIEKGPSFMPDLKGYASTGNGGQILWIMPEDDAVIVMTGGNYNNELSQTQPMEMMIRYIYPALKKR